MRAAEVARAGDTVVDFGSGTGNLLLPLASLFPQLNFVGLDLNARSLALLQERAEAAHLTNVSTTVGLIEEYTGPCDIAVALHVCGAGTDAGPNRIRNRNRNRNSNPNPNPDTNRSTASSTGKRQRLCGCALLRR